MKAQNTDAGVRMRGERNGFDDEAPAETDKMLENGTQISQSSVSIEVASDRNNSSARDGVTAEAKPEATPAPAAPAPSGGMESTMKALPTICFWIFMSCSVILFNKWLYNGTFSHPLTLTCIHMLFATVSTTVLRLAGRLAVPSFDWGFISQRIVPIGFLFACSLGLSNLAAVRLSVAFVQMIKALMPMFTLAVSVLMGMEQATTALAVVVTLMSFGVMIASYGEIHFEIFGFAYQLGSIVTESSRLVATQSLLQEHLPKGSSPLVSISLFAPWSFAFLLPVALYNEPGAFAKLATYEIGVPVAINTLTAFTLNMAVVMLVAQTSGLTLTLAGIVKDILLIVASILVFGSPITYIQVFGYLVALYGLNCYHIYRGCKGNIELPVLAKQAATNKSMAVMAAGMVALSFLARSH